MYQPETSYEEFLKSEQEKYPELNLKDIEVLTERLKANADLPPLRGTVLYVVLQRLPYGLHSTCHRIK